MPTFISYHKTFSRKDRVEMDTRMGASPNQVFEDFVPKSELVTEADADILQIYLPDFKKEQLRVQVTRSGILRINGQRPKEGNRWLRFHKEFPISANCIQNKITAKYERGILFVRQPKMIISEKQLPAEPMHPPLPQKPAADDEQRKAGEEPTKKPEEQAKTPAANQQKPGEEPSKTAEEEQRKSETAVSEAKTASERSVEAKKSGGGVVEDETKKSSKKELSDSRNAGKIERYGTSLATILRQPRRILNVAMVVLVVVGIWMYVNNMIRSSSEAEE